MKIRENQEKQYFYNRVLTKRPIAVPFKSLPLPRLLTLVVGLSLILGMVIWLIDAILRLYFQVSWTSPFLANLLILLIIGLLGLLIYAFFYYFNLTRPKTATSRRRHRIKLPEQKHETVRHFMVQRAHTSGENCIGETDNLIGETVS